MCSSVSSREETCSFSPRDLNLTYQLGSGRSWLYDIAAEHLYSNTLLEKYSKGMRKEERTQYLKEFHISTMRSLAQKLIVVFLQEKALIRLL